MCITPFHVEHEGSVPLRQYRRPGSRRLRERFTWNGNRRQCPFPRSSSLCLTVDSGRIMFVAFHRTKDGKTRSWREGAVVLADRLAAPIGLRVPRRTVIGHPSLAAESSGRADGDARDDHDHANANSLHKRWPTHHRAGWFVDEVRTFVPVLRRGPRENPSVSTIRFT